MTAQGGANGRVLMLGLATMAFVVVAFAATGGPVPMATEGADGWSMRIPEQRRDVERSELDDRLLSEPADSAAVDVASVLAQVIGIVVVAVIVFFLGQALVRALSASLPEPPPVVDTAQLAAPSGAPQDELSAAVDDGLATLASGPVDDVIIACWVRLEAAAAAGGVSRQPSETCAELAVRMLARFDVPPEPVERLLSRYRAARYSRHRLGEDDRAAAIAALQEIGAAMAVAP